jgi:hypothetical protein
MDKKLNRLINNKFIVSRKPIGEKIDNLYNKYNIIFIDKKYDRYDIVHKFKSNVKYMKLFIIIMLQNDGNKYMLYVKVGTAQKRVFDILKSKILRFLLKYRKLKRRISTEKIEILNTQKQRITQQINKDKLQIQEYKNIFTAEMKNIQQVNTGGNPDVIESNQQYMGTITDDIYN